jgi:hypothetical protein
MHAVLAIARRLAQGPTVRAATSDSKPTSWCVIPAYRAGKHNIPPAIHTTHVIASFGLLKIHRLHGSVDVTTAPLHIEVEGEGCRSHAGSSGAPALVSPWHKYFLLNTPVLTPYRYLPMKPELNYRIPGQETHPICAATPPKTLRQKRQFRHQAIADPGRAVTRT